MRRTLSYLGMLVPIFVLGYTWGGPTSTQRISAGFWAMGVFLGVFVAIYLLLTIVVRVRLGPLYRPIKQAQRELEAMSDEQLRTAAIMAIETTGYFRSSPATIPIEPGWPQGVADFFSVYDSVDFVLPGTSSAYLSICRALVGPLDQNPGMLKVGEWYPLGSYIAVCRETGRTVSGYRVVPARQMSRHLESRQLSQLSLWHYIALCAAQHRIAALLGKPVYTRSPQHDTRPQWRRIDEPAQTA